MRDILYISNINNIGGWSIAAESHIRALLKKFNVAAPHVNIGSGQRNIQLGSKTLTGDVCIQQVLPDFAVPDKRFYKNIIVYFSETNSLPPSWADSINRFDGAVVSCASMKEAAETSGVNIPIHIIPIPLDTNKILELAKTAKENELRKAFKRQCLFYTIADFNSRKNLYATIAAFHLTFAPDENVQLVIKLPGNSEESIKFINELADKVKSNLRLYADINNYKKEIVASGYSSWEDLIQFHLNCDIFVNSSSGEAFSIPSLEAFLLKRYCIFPLHTSFKDYFMSMSNGAKFFNSFEVPCMGANSPPGLHTAREHWYEADVISLSRVMRETYEEWKKNKDSPNKIGTLLKELSYESISRKWENILS